MENEKRLIDISKFREALRKYLNSPADRKTGPVCYGMRIAIRHCIELIEGQKPVDAVEVLHGWWIRKPTGKYTGVDEVCCSICGCFVGVVASDAGFREAIEGMNYCPSCGAKMDGAAYG